MSQMFTLMHLLDSNSVTKDRLLVSYPTLFFVPTALAVPTHNHTSTLALLDLLLTLPRTEQP